MLSELIHPPNCSKSSNSSSSKTQETAKSTPKKDVSTNLATATPATPATDEMPDFWMLMEITREATKGTNCDSRDLANFLIRCGDPGWYTPEAAWWWARYYEKRGRFPE